MNQDLTAKLLERLEGYCGLNGLESLPSAQLRLLAQNAVKSGGMPPEAVETRLPRGYKEHAEGFFQVINDTLQSAGLSADGDGPRAAQAVEPASAPARPSHPDPTPTATQPDGTDGNRVETGFLPTHGSPELPKFIESVRTVVHSTAARPTLGMVDTGFHLSWEPVDAPHVLYRVTRSAGPVDFPEYSHYTAVTSATSLLDDSLPRWPRVHYQVWAHSSGTAGQETFAQPVLVAGRSIVIPPQGVSIVADQGRVLGTWRDIGARNGRVQVYRKPQHGVPGLPTDPQFRVNTDSDNVAGFVDSDVDGGQRYIYSVAVELLDDQGVGDVSPFVERLVDVPHKIEPVRDLDVEVRRDDKGQIVFDVVWTPPGAGEVEIFVNREQPEAGIEVSAQPAAKFDQFKLGDRLPYPVTDRMGDRVRIRNIPWYDGWSRVHFTAVTFLDEKIYASQTVTQVATQVAITEAKLHQRVSHQVITLTWPASGDSEDYTFERVQVFRMTSDGQAQAAMQGAELGSISAEAYANEGGLTVQLGSRPCRLALVPISMQKGQQVQGQPYELSYPGLRQVEYQVKRAPALFGKTRKLSIKLRSPEPQTGLPPLVVIYHADRLPLDAADGERCQVTVKDDPESIPKACIEATEVGSTWTEATWEVTVPATGFVRVMADIAAVRLNRYAVIDPSISQLRVG